LPVLRGRDLVVDRALSHFGTFSGLQGIASSSTDVYPYTQSFTFYHSTYLSSYLNFMPVENEDTNENSLQNPTAAEVKVLEEWDDRDGVFSFPFLDIGGRYVGALPSWLDPACCKGSRGPKSPRI
jgi:hypothetical protein